MIVSKNGRAISQAKFNELRDDADYTEEHMHHKTRWYTKKATPTATAWADALDGHLANPWRCTSGAGVYGADGSHDPAGDPSDEAFLFGADDVLAELGSGFVYGDFDMILITANSSATLYLMRIIWATGVQTMAQAISAGQYTTMPYIRTASDTVRKIMTFATPKISIGARIYMQCQNATDNATIDFILGVHAYDF